MKSSQQMTDALKGVTKAMSQMNRQIKLPGIQKIMMDFERESELMDMKQEMMEDAIEDVMEEGTDEAESDEIVQQVFDEIGINLDQSVHLQQKKRLTLFYSLRTLLKINWLQKNKSKRKLSLKVVEAWKTLSSKHDWTSSVKDNKQVLCVNSSPLSWRYLDLFLFWSYLVFIF